MRVKDPAVSSPLFDKVLFFVMCDFYIFGVNCFYGRFYLMYFGFFYYLSFSF